MFVDENENEEVVEEQSPETTESSEDLKLKYYSVELPSKGRLGYPAEIEYRDILVRDEKILSTATGKNYEKVIMNVLKSLLKDQSLFENLSVYDKEFLLLWIWANNYTTIKEFDVTCPYCENKDDLKIDLTEVDIDEISDEYTDPFEMELANGETVSLRLLTVKDEMIAKKFCDENKGYEESLVKLVMSISFKRIMPLKEKLQYVEENMTGRDMGMVRAFHDYFSYGVNDKIDHECSSCGEVTTFDIPFSVEFFLPTLQQDFKEIVRSNKKSKHKSK